MTGQAPRMEGRYVRLRTIDWAVPRKRRLGVWPPDLRDLYGLFSLPQNQWRLGRSHPDPDAVRRRDHRRSARALPVRRVTEE